MKNKPSYQNFNYNISEDLPPRPNNYLNLSIVGIIIGTIGGFCFIGFIFGLIGLIYSNQVYTKYYQGDYNGAQQSSSMARLVSIIAIVIGGIGLIAIISYFLIILFVSAYHIKN